VKCRHDIARVQVVTNLIKKRCAISPSMNDTAIDQYLPSIRNVQLRGAPYQACNAGVSKDS
jgi:hypothetical protein